MLIYINIFYSLHPFIPNTRLQYICYTFLSGLVFKVVINTLPLLLGTASYSEKAGSLGMVLAGQRIGTWSKVGQSGPPKILHLKQRQWGAGIATNSEAKGKPQITMSIQELRKLVCVPGEKNEAEEDRERRMWDSRAFPVLVHNSSWSRTVRLSVQDTPRILRLNFFFVLLLMMMVCCLCVYLLKAA